MRASVVVCQVLLFLALWAVPRPGQAQEERRQQCIQAYESGQRLKKMGELVDAASQFAFCESQICPRLMRDDCAARLLEVKQAAPSIALSVKFVGAEAPVRVSIDGHARAWAKEEANLVVNPGRHELRVEADGFPSQTQTLLLGEGEHVAPVEVRFTARASPAAKTPANGDAATARSAMSPATSHSPPTAAIVVTASSVIGVSGFVYFGLTARERERELEQRQCAPFCSNEEVSRVKRSYLLANASLGLAAASLLTGAILFLVHAHEAPPSKSHSARTTVELAPAYLGLRAEF